MNKSTFLLPWIVFFATTSFAQIDFKNVSPEKAKSNAALSELPFFVYVSAPWCISCQIMDETTFQSEVVSSAVKGRYDSYKVDFDSESGKKWVEEFDICCLPTFLFFKADGEISKKIQAPFTSTAFAGLLNNPATYANQPPTKNAKNINLYNHESSPKNEGGNEVLVFSESNNEMPAELIKGELLYHLDKQISALEMLYIKYGISKKTHIDQEISIVKKPLKIGAAASPVSTSRNYPCSEIIENTENLYTLIQEMKDWNYRLKNSDYDVAPALVSSTDLPTESTSFGIFYRVQMGYFQSEAYATRMSEDLKRNFEYPIEIRKEEKREGTFYRVLLGAFSNENEAKKTYKKMRAEGRKALVKQL